VGVGLKCNLCVDNGKGRVFICTLVHDGSQGLPEDGHDANLQTCVSRGGERGLP